MIHPIAYPCGCVFVFMIDRTGWLLIDASDRMDMQASKLCKDHVKEIARAGGWR